MTILMELAKAQKASEERQAKFETRVEKKIESFLNGQSQIRSRKVSVQNSIRVPNHSNARMELPNRTNRNRHQQEIDVHVMPNWDDFEELDENFPIDWSENIAQLE